MNSPDMFELQQRAAAALKNAQAYLKEQAVKCLNPEAFGWTQYLEEKQRYPNRPPGITGATCGLVALIACGESPASHWVKGAREVIKSFQRPDGGWSTSPLHEHFSLTRPTCLSVSALALAGEPPESPSLVRAAEWLVSARNADGAWGNSKQDGVSDIVSTGLAIEALAKLDRGCLGVEEGLATAAEWISRADNSQGSSPVLEPEKTLTVVQSAHVIAALTAYGTPRALIRGRVECLIKRIEDIDGGQLPNYEIQIHDGAVYSGPDGTWDQKFTWKHLPLQRSLLALLGAGVVLGQHPILVKILEGVINEQKPQGYWLIVAPRERVPVWLVTENCRVLRRFVDYVEEQRAYLALRQEFQQTITEFETRLRPFVGSPKEQSNHLTLVQDTRKSLSEFESRLSKLESNRISARVGSLLLRVAKPARSLWHAFVERPGVQLLVYTFLGAAMTATLLYIDVNTLTAIGTTAGVIAVLITLITQFRKSR